MDLLKNLFKVSQAMEKNFTPRNFFEEVVTKEREDSWKYGGRTVMGDAKKPEEKNRQLSLWD
ncbi:MAG: hypothetical protein LUE93_14685 [Bacteroides sp.]|nr:hypothetical protein [Bacteroides sp.]